MSEPARAEATTAERVLFFLAVGALAWMPFPYGSNRPWAEAVAAGWLGILLLIWSAAAIAGGVRITTTVAHLRVPAMLFAYAIAWAVFQQIDVNLLGLATLAHPVWSMLGEALSVNHAAYISVDPQMTRDAIFAAIIPAIAFALMFFLARQAQHARWLLYALVAIGCAYAVLAFIELYLKLDLHSWLMADAKGADTRMSGPFINPNHFATFVGLCALPAFAFFFEALLATVVWDRGRAVMWRTVLATVTANAVWLAAALLLASALVLTQSRGGLAAFLVSFLSLLGILVLGARKRRSAKGARRLAIIPAAAVFVLVAWISAAPLLERTQQQGLADDARVSIAQSTLAAIVAAPLLGNGFGAFERYYPLYADGAVEGDVDEAHNDYLETFADLGLPAGLAFIGAPLWLAYVCAAGAMRRNRDRIYPAIGAAAAVLVGAHALVDFSLQIPAVATLFAAMLGAGAAQSWRTRDADGATQF